MGRIIIAIGVLIVLFFSFPYLWEGSADTASAQAALWAVVPIVLAAGPGRPYFGRENLYAEVTPASSAPLASAGTSAAGRYRRPGVPRS